MMKSPNNIWSLGFFKPDGEPGQTDVLKKGVDVCIYVSS